MEQLRDGKDPELSSDRHLHGLPRRVQAVVLAAITGVGVSYVLGLHYSLGITLYTEQYIGLFLTLVLVGTFMSVPGSKSAPRDRVAWGDVLLCIAALPVGLYIVIFYPELSHRLGEIHPIQVAFGAAAVVLVLEAVRRLIGWPLVIVVLAILFYARFAGSFPGLFQGRSMTSERLLTYIYLDPNSMPGLLTLGGTIGLAFVLFGQVLLNMGGGKSLVDLSLSLFGRFTGGPSKVAVVSSMLFGTVSGAPMANVILTGSFTIPMMKRVGYPPPTAGAIEAVASTGGQILPPVMGIAAFLIAENLRIPYTEVALAALVPALLFYVAVFVATDLEARKRAIARLDESALLPVSAALRLAGPTLLSFILLVYLMFVVRYGIATAGVLASAFAAVVLMIRKENYTRLGSRLLSIFEGTGRTLLSVAIALAVAGIVVGAISISGIGFILTAAFSSIGQESVALLLLLTAVTAAILGMGMPTVAAYALVAVLMVPGLVMHGVNPLAAHLFVMYYAVLSNITPPIALACFAAAPLAGASPVRVGFESMRIGITAFFIPFAFVLRPGLILTEGFSGLLVPALSGLAGVLLFAVGAIGYVRTQLSPLARAVSVVLGTVALVAPNGLISLGTGLVGLLVVAAFEKRRVERVAGGEVPMVRGR